MNRVVATWQKISQKFNFSSFNVVIDWGGANLRIIKDGQIVFQQPSCYLEKVDQKFLLSFGKQAYQLLGKNPSGTQIIYPIRQGAIYDLTQAEIMLAAVFHEFNIQNNLPFWQRNKIQIIVPNFSTNLDKKLWRRLFGNLGWQKIQISTNGEAVFHYLQKNKQIENNDLLLIDVGAQLTNLSFIINGQVLQMDAIELGSEDLTRAIQRSVLQVHKLRISWQVAELVKRRLQDSWLLLSQECQDDEAIVAMRQRLQEQKINIRGMNVENKLVQTQTINFASLYEQVFFWAQDLKEKIKAQFSQLEPEQLVDVLASGIYLTGGGSQLQGLANFFQQEFKSSVMEAEQPELVAVKGGVEV